MKFLNTWKQFCHWKAWWPVTLFTSILSGWLVPLPAMCFHTFLYHNLELYYSKLNAQITSVLFAKSWLNWRLKSYPMYADNNSAALSILWTAVIAPQHNCIGHQLRSCPFQRFCSLLQDFWCSTETSWVKNMINSVYFVSNSSFHLRFSHCTGNFGICLQHYIVCKEHINNHTDGTVLHQHSGPGEHFVSLTESHEPLSPKKETLLH